MLFGMILEELLEGYDRTEGIYAAAEYLARKRQNSRDEERKKKEKGKEKRKDYYDTPKPRKKKGE